MAPKKLTAVDDEPAAAAPVRVMATRMGYIHNERKRKGDVFDVPANGVSQRWMEKVHASTATTVSNSLTALQRQLAELKSGALAPARSDADEVL